ncbi:MAG: hypothetical protein ACLQHK_10875 [Gallionellaceae bacterium]
MRAVSSYKHCTLAAYSKVCAGRYPDVTLRTAIKGHALSALTAAMRSALVTVGLILRPQ